MMFLSNNNLDIHQLCYFSNFEAIFQTSIVFTENVLIEIRFTLKCFSFWKVTFIDIPVRDIFIIQESDSVTLKVFKGFHVP